MKVDKIPLNLYKVSIELTQQEAADLQSFFMECTGGYGSACVDDWVVTEELLSELRKAKL